MLADRDSEVSIERLKGHVDGFLGAGAGGRVRCGPGEVWHGERPADESQELDESGEDSDRGGDGEDRRVGVGERRRHQHRGRGQEHRAHREPPPRQDQATSSRPESGKYFRRGSAEDVGIVK